MGDFERFKAAYPKREGSNPWKPAEQKFCALVKAGVDPEKIIQAAQQFARDEAKNVGTRFIPMARTWLNQWRFADIEVKAEAPPPMDWDAVCISFKKFGRWNRYAGPDPDSPACRCPREILAKHGIAA